MAVTETSRSRSRGRWDEGERVAFLGSLPVFRQLPPAAIRDVAARIRSRPVVRGDAVFLQEDTASALWILATGRMKLVNETGDGREVIIRLIRPGDIFGGAGVWGEPRYPASAFAQEDSVVLHLLAPEFTALLGVYPELALALIRLLAARLRDAEARIRELQTEQVEQRIANVLLRLANRTGVQTTAGIRIGTALTRLDLAELSGTTLSTASRTLSAWHQRGIVAAGREQVTILQPHALVAIANHLAPDHAVSLRDEARVGRVDRLHRPGAGTLSS
ncbi:MAG TPA: Crp/Fnr family transcriptional regulator [Chloroflexota bacterium]|nr:Crp/Fnr family transcriptional regulator [Chloroflexota bacterium]